MRAQLDDRAGDARSSGRRCCRRSSDRLSALGVLLHELEEPLLAGTAAERRPTALTEAGYWLDRAAATVADAQSDARAARRLDRLDVDVAARRHRRAGAGPEPGRARRLVRSLPRATAPTGRRPRAPAIEQARRLRRRADRARRAAGRARRRPRRGDRVRLPLRRRAAAVLDRLQRRRTAGSTTRTTTRWRRKRGWPASSRSPPAQSRTSTGSSSDDR